MRTKAEQAPKDYAIILSQAYDSLTGSERRVAEITTRLGIRVVSLSLSELAAEAKSSEATVLRFCKKLGYAGIKELKNAVLSSCREADFLASDAAPPEENPINRQLSFVMKRMKEILDKTEDLLDREALRKAAEILRGSDYIKAVGVGASAVVARHAQHYFRKAGLRVDLLANPDHEECLLEHYSERDAIFAISRSGDNAAINALLARAKAGGAAIICLTSWGCREMICYADVVLQTPNGGSSIFDGMHALERTAQFAVVNALLLNLISQA